MPLYVACFQVLILPIESVKRRINFTDVEDILFHHGGYFILYVSHYPPCFLPDLPCSLYCPPMFFFIFLSYLSYMTRLCFSNVSSFSSTVYCLLRRYKLFTLLLLIFVSRSFNASSRLSLVVALLS